MGQRSLAACNREADAEEIAIGDTRSLPRTMVYVRAEPNIVPTYESYTWYVSGRTTDVSRTVPIYESYTLYGSGRTTDVSSTVPIYESYTLYVSGRTTDVCRAQCPSTRVTLCTVRDARRTCVEHSAHLRKLHSVRFGTHDGRVSSTVPICESYTLYVSGRTTDVSRAVPICERYTLHRTILAPALAIT